MRRRILPKLTRRARRADEPLELRLTVEMNVGAEPGDKLTLLDDRRIPLVGSVFDHRDRIAREFLRLLVQAGFRQPAIARKFWPTRGRR